MIFLYFVCAIVQFIHVFLITIYLICAIDFDYYNLNWILTSKQINFFLFFLQ